MIDVAIRFDDPSAVSDHALERSLLAVLAEKGGCATFAVIPCAEGQAVKADLVPHLLEAQRAGIVEIAQHGYDHSARPGTPGYPPSEFAGLDPAAQADRIALGKALLEREFAAPIKGFVPPFNTFDQATASILERQGFRYLSAGGEHGQPEVSSLALLPRSCQAFDLRQAIAEAWRRKSAAPAIIAVMHHYDFVEHGRADARLSIGRFAQLLAWILRQPDVRLATLSGLADRHPSDIWSAAVRRGRQRDRLHWRLRHMLPTHCLMTHPLWRYLRIPERSAND